MFKKDKRKKEEESQEKTPSPKTCHLEKNCLESRFLFNKQWSIELIKHEHITAEFVVAAADNCSSRAWEY